MNPRSLRRKRESCAPRSRVTSRPPSMIFPEVTGSIVATQFRSVLFPDPEGPMMATNSPVSMASETSSRAVVMESLFPNSLPTCSMESTCDAPLAFAVAVCRTGDGGLLALRSLVVVSAAVRAVVVGALPPLSVRVMFRSLRSAVELPYVLHGTKSFFAAPSIALTRT